MEGVSLKYSFDDAKAPERHKTQYFEIAGNRALYHDGWFARTIHRAPWEPKPRASLTEDTWQLYDVRSDFSLSKDLAAAQPAKLEEMKALFLDEARKYNVLPIDDRVFERLLPAVVGRPDLMAGRTSLTLAEGMTGMMENVFINVKNKSKAITAEVEVPKGGANGTILAQGGRFGGWSLYVKDGVPAYDYNFLGLQRFSVASVKKLAPGKHTVTVVRPGYGTKTVEVEAKPGAAIEDERVKAIRREGELDHDPLRRRRFEGDQRDPSVRAAAAKVGRRERLPLNPDRFRRDRSREGEADLQRSPGGGEAQGQPPPPIQSGLLPEHLEGRVRQSKRRQRRHEGRGGLRPRKRHCPPLEGCGLRHARGKPA